VAKDFERPDCARAAGDGDLKKAPFEITEITSPTARTKLWRTRRQSGRRETRFFPTGPTLPATWRDCLEPRKKKTKAGWINYRASRSIRAVHQGQRGPRVSPSAKGRAVGERAGEGFFWTETGRVVLAKNRPLRRARYTRDRYEKKASMLGSVAEPLLQVLLLPKPPDISVARVSVNSCLDANQARPTRGH